MDGGGLVTIPIQRSYQPRHYFPPQINKAPLQQQAPASFQPQQNANQSQQVHGMPADPNKEAVPGQVVMFDGKRMRKAVHRKTVDYNSAVIKYLENRCWQRDYRDARAIMPDSLYQIDLTPPMSMITNPTNCVTTKFIRTSTNKFRCPIFCLAWTPEGRRLVTGASSGEFTLWNGLTFNFETILQAHDTSVRAMMWSNNDSWMVTGDHSGFIKYWQTNMNNVKMFQGHKEPVRGISFAPSDNKFTTCSDDGTVRIWDFQLCTEEKTLRGHGADVKCVSWHPQKSLIASGSKDNQQPLKLWDPKSGACLATIHAHKMTVMQLQWNRNGNWLLTASRDHLIKLFDIRNMKEEVQTFKGHKKEATAIDWHPIHEGLFVSGGSDGALMFWHVGTDRELGGMEYAHEGMVWSLAWHPLGHILASGSNDHTTKFWTRNRPGDRMRDRYNLNQLNGSEHELPEFDLENTAPIVTPMSSIPGVNEGSVPEPSFSNGDTEEDVSIPGLDWETDSKFLKDHHREHNQRRKIPYSRPIDREFVHAWRSNKQPPAISGEKIEEKDKKPKQPLPSLLDLPSMQPTGELDLETLKDEEADKQGRQLRMRNKDLQRERRGGRDRDRDRDRDWDRDRDIDRDRDRDRGSRHRYDRDRNNSQNMDDDYEERMTEKSLIEMQERMDNSRDGMDSDEDERPRGLMGNRPNMPGNFGPMGPRPGLMGNQPGMPGMMGNQQGMMGNQQGMMGNQQGMMGNQPGMMGNQQGMMGNQQGMMGNQQGMMGNQQSMPGNQMRNQQGMMGNQQGMMGNQQGMMGNQQGLMGNQPGRMGNQGLMEKPDQKMMGNPQGMMRPNQPGMMGNQNMMGQNRPALMGNQPGMRGPNPGMMGQNRPGFMGNRPGMPGQMGPQGPGGQQGNRMGGPGPQGGPRMPLLGQGPGIPNQGGPGPNRPFNQDMDMRGPNQGQNQRGGPMDTDFRNQDSDFRKRDSDFGDNDMRQRKGDNFNNDRDNRFDNNQMGPGQNRQGHGPNRQGQGQNRQEEMMDFDDRESFNRGGRNRDWNEGGGRGGGRGGRGRGGWRGGR